MKRQDNKNIRIKTVVIITVAILVAILLMSYQSFKAAETTNLNEFNKRQEVLAHEAGNSIEFYFLAIFVDLVELAEIPEVQQLEETISQKELKERLGELERFGVNDAAILDSKGIVRYNINAPQIIGIDFSWRDYFKEAKELNSSEDYVLEFIDFQGVEVGKKGVLVAVPLFNNQEFTGVVVATLKLNTVVEEFIKGIKSLETGSVFLIDSKKNLLWAPSRIFLEEDTEEMIRESERFGEISNQINIGETNTLEYSYYQIDELGKYTEGKKEHVAVYHPINLGKDIWTIGVLAPKEDVRELIRSIYARQLWLMLVTIFIVIIASFYIIRFIQNYNKTLQQEVEKRTLSLKKSEQASKKKSEQLERFVKVTIGREEKMIELKRKMAKYTKTSKNE